MRKFPIKYLLIAFILYGCFTRIVQLDKRSLHHDESQHASFALSWFESPDTGYYKFKPAYHGPVLYYLTTKVYALFGVGIHQARLLPLLFGLFLIFGLFLWSGYLGHWQTWTAATFMSLSPIMGYFSTFLVHDFLCLVLIFVLVTFMFKFLSEERRLSWVDFLIFGIAFGILNAAKLIGVIYLVLISGYFIFFFFMSRKKIKFMNSKGIVLSIGAFIVGFVYFYVCFQSSVFKNMNSAWSGLLGENLAYWWNQHSVSRIKGSIWYHLRNLLIYETFIGVSLFIILALYLRKFFIKKRIGLLFSLFVSLGVFVCLILNMYSPKMYLSIFKLSSYGNILIYVLCAVSGLFIAGVDFRISKIRSFLWYMLGSNLAVFSYIGEKVPWLSVYVVFFAVLLVSQYIPIWFQYAKNIKKSKMYYLVLFPLVLLLILQVRVFHQVSYKTAGSGTDLLDQVHNSDYPRYFTSMLTKKASPQKPIHILSVGSELSWSMYFYLRLTKNVHWGGSVENFHQKQEFLFLDSAARAKILAKHSLSEYELKTYSMSRWWTPYYVNISLKEWCYYFWYRVLQKGSGDRKFYLYYKKGLEKKFNLNPNDKELLATRRIYREEKL